MMKNLKSYPASKNNPYFYAGMTFMNTGIITIPSWKGDEILKLNQFELKAFLIIIFSYHDQKSCPWFKELKVMYHSKVLRNYFDITLAKARQVTISLLDRDIIHRSEEMHFYFINPEYIVNLVNPVDHPIYNILRNEEGEVIDAIEVDYSITPPPVDLGEIFGDW